MKHFLKSTTLQLRAAMGLFLAVMVMVAVLPTFSEAPVTVTEPPFCAAVKPGDAVALTKLKQPFSTSCSNTS